MDVQLTVKNYRPFSRVEPLRFRLRNGFTAFVGANNSGKSSILRMFFELRGLFQIFQQAGHFFTARNTPIPFTLQGVDENAEVFCNDNDGELVIRFEYSTNLSAEGVVAPDWIELRIQREQSSCRLWYSVQRRIIEDPSPHGEFVRDGVFSPSGSDQQIDFGPFFEVCGAAFRSLYIGPFRNALNIPGADQYFDIPVGHQFVAKWSAAKGGNNAVLRARMMQVTDVIQDIFGLTRLEINPSQSGQSLILMLAG